MPPVAILGAGLVGSTIASAVGGSKAAGALASAAGQAYKTYGAAGDKAGQAWKDVWGQTQGNLNPYLTGGTAGLANLENLLGINPTGTYSPYGASGGTAQMSSLINPQLGATGSLATGWNTPFVAPTAATEMNDPGYQFRMQQGINALQNSAAARGTLLTGATAAGINAYGQDYASNEYQNVYNRQLQQYQQAYNIFQQNQANEYNRLRDLTGIGQQTGEELGQFGQQYAQGYGNILMGTAQGQANALLNKGTAQAYGDVSLANTIGSGISGGAALGAAYQSGYFNKAKAGG